MKKIRIIRFSSIYFIYLLVFYILLFAIFSSRAVAGGTGERSIFIGDLITLKISADGYSLEGLLGEITEFEIVESRQQGDDYLLTLRTFEPGEYRIVLGDKELLIKVSSTLDELERDGIFTLDPQPLDSLYNPYWKYIFLALSILFLTFLYFFIRLFIKEKREKALGSHALFQKRVAELDIDSADYFVELSLSFKEYLEKTFACRLRGKTSREIMEELRGIALLEEKRAEIEDWLLQADRYNYTGKLPDRETREKGRENLDQIVLDIEKSLQAGEGY